MEKARISAESPTPRDGRDAVSSAALTIVLLYAAFGTLWVLLSDQAVEWLLKDPAATALAGTLKGVLFVAITSLLLYGLLRRWRPLDRTSASEPRARFMVLPLALIASAVLLATTVGIIHSLKQQRGTELARLQAIANLKTQLIGKWLSDHERELRLAQTSAELVEDYHRWREQGDRTAFEHLTKRLGDYRTALGYTEIMILAADGEVLWTSAGTAAGAAGPALREAAEQSIRQGAPHRIGPYRMDSGRLVIDFIAPIAGTHAEPAAMVFREDPTTALYVDLQTWPVNSASAESLLFRRDGDDVLYLSALSHAPDAAARLRVPLTETDVIAVKAARGDVGPDQVVEGVDYRKAPSLGVVRAVPGTDWFLVAKLDQAEVYANVAPRLTWIAVSGLLALMVAVSAAAMLRQQTRLMLARQFGESQAEKLHTLRMLDALSECSTDAIVAKDLTGRYQLCNPAAARLVGKTPGEVMGLDEAALFPAEQADAMMRRDQTVIAQDRVTTVQEQFESAAGKVTLLTTMGPLHDAAHNTIGLFRISRDITALIRAEETARLWAQAFHHAEFGLALGSGADNTFIAVNPCFARERGYEPEELVGQPIMTVYPPEVHDEIRRRIGELDPIGHSVFESVHQRRNGQCFPVLMDITVIQFPDGGPAQRVVYALDITDRKETETQLAAQIHELRRWQEVTLGREGRVLELKHEVNELRRRLGEPPRYHSVCPDTDAADLWPGETKAPPTA